MTPPPDLSEDEKMQMIGAAARSLNSNEARMRDLALLLQKIGEELDKDLLELLDGHGRKKLVISRIRLVRITEAHLIGWLRLRATELGVVAFGGVIATVLISGALKMLWGEVNLEKMKALGNEFLGSVKQLKTHLESIKHEMSWIFRQGSQLETRVEDVLHEIAVFEEMGESFRSTINVLGPAGNRGIDKELKDSIIQASDQSEKVLDKFVGLREDFQRITVRT